MPTDPRAALRAAAFLMSSAAKHFDDCDRMRIALDRRCDELRALADAPPTVAELLPMVDARHRVRWLAAGDHHEAWCDDRGTIGFSILDANDRHAQFTDLNVDDLDRPARLDEVSP